MESSLDWMVLREIVTTEDRFRRTGSLDSFMTNDRSILLDVVLKPELKERLSPHFMVVSS